MLNTEHCDGDTPSITQSALSMRSTEAPRFLRNARGSRPVAATYLREKRETTNNTHAHNHAVALFSSSDVSRN